LITSLGYKIASNNQNQIIYPRLDIDPKLDFQADLKAFINHATSLNINCELTVLDPNDPNESIINTGIRFVVDNKKSYKPILAGIKSMVKKYTYTPCLFLDRDGILIKDTGYPHQPSELIYKDEIIPVIQLANYKKIPVIIVTNQSGIARGIFNQDQYYQCEDVINDYFRNNDAIINHWYHCPFLTDANVKEYKRDSLYRKPAPGMILKCFEHYLVDLEKSLMIGDKSSDKIKLIGLESVIVDVKLKNLTDKTDLIDVVRDKFLK
jgi:D,D-heptose 1,7-bisphosphate phosphatase